MRDIEQTKIIKKEKKEKMKIFITIIGIIGFIAGIFLTLNGNKIMGISGALASAGIFVKGINDIRKDKK
ncbi:hypothetical protein [Salegentibacter sp. Hel_I_6]|uniref:hypothetical protein n=1 Tax=Salegentibacter sp. Hel_I_6 TaxID=1250278 RepID=UPI000565741B|nr:hypothetical protein [Salegentibacter sp. Hel_I_6]